MITLGAGIYMRVYATRARAATYCGRNVFNSTLDHLQMLPQPEERWVWWMSAHPMLLSWLIALAGLPVYALAIITGAWSMRDLIGVALCSRCWAWSRRPGSRNYGNSSRPEKRQSRGKST
jgi:hypothetical protein